MLDLELLKPERVIPRSRRLSRRAYDALVARGVFDDERIELLRGQLVTMSPQGGLHATVTARLAQRLVRALDESYDVRAHSPYAASDDSEPEPDISVSRRARRLRYHPSKALLLIEVAESSLSKDRRVKAEIYAENRAPEYWIVDLASRSVFVHTDPGRGTYRSVVQLSRKDVLRPVCLPGIALTVGELFRSSR
ncbi:MAG TPA: Uma2 family endonuclease [Kofleriaceae bacterium]